ncbi:MAG TPA: biotin--[acetyl-CoA-carboxylase] ligase [Candidatus Limnocylindria bacterium]|nr:biotin--[acetyl-CoA-carboxylase] ligase [Candidatus Limnocylindria bacterium]
MTLDAKILSMLREADETGITSASLATKTGSNAAAVSQRVVELCRLGYDIESTPHLGYRFLSAPDLLHADDLVSRLSPNRIVGRDIQVFQETSSTNDVVEKLARDGVAEGVVVFAESQTKGRGRMGRKWLSPPGRGLWFSVLLRPLMPPSSVTQLTIAAATAVARAVRVETGLALQIKWPNDILIHGKKAVGILTELSAELDQVRYVVIGIGVDVNITEFPAELAEIATSLSAAAGKNFIRAEIAAAILRELDTDYARVTRGEFAALAEEWEQQCVTLGQRVQIHIGDRTVAGRAESLDNDGALLLRTDYGHLERIVGGDVVLEK